MSRDLEAEPPNAQRLFATLSPVTCSVKIPCAEHFCASLMYAGNFLFYAGNFDAQNFTEKNKNTLGVQKFLRYA